MPQALMTTKLRVPRTRAILVERPRPHEVLDRGSKCALTLVSAPAGFGKTTLLVEWLTGHSGDERSAVWVSLDESDNDPARFLSYLVGALRNVEEGLGEGVLASLRSPELPPVEAVVGALINELAEVSHGVTAILDDYHLIDSGRVHEAITFLLEHLPENVGLVISTRADPPLPLSKLRARDQVTEIGAAELRFTADEAAAFLEGVMGLSLSAGEIAALGEPPSERELEVLALIAAGRSNREIAARLFVSASTVKTHINRLYRKLGARSRTQAVGRAREMDLL